MGGTGRYGGGGGRVLGRGRREGRWRRGEPPVIIIRDNHTLSRNNFCAERLTPSRLAVNMKDRRD